MALNVGWHHGFPIDMSNFTAVDFFLPGSYCSPAKDLDPHDFYIPPQVNPADRTTPDPRLVALDDLYRDRQGKYFEPCITKDQSLTSEDPPISTSASSTLQKLQLPQDNMQAGQKFSPDAFQLPNPDHESLAKHADMQEFGPEAFTLPGIEPSVDDSRFWPENFQLPDPKPPVKQTHAPVFLPEDFQLPVIKPRVEKMEMNAFAPNNFVLPDPSGMCSLIITSYLSSLLPQASKRGHHTLPPFSPTILAELRFLGAEHPSVGDRGARSRSLESHLQVRRNVSNAGLRLLTLESHLVEQHFHTVDMIQAIDRSLALLSHTLVRQIPTYDTNHPPPMP